jgi:hypothetical protein
MDAPDASMKKTIQSTASSNSQSRSRSNGYASSSTSGGISFAL